MNPQVYNAMRPYLTNQFGNAASLNHVFGWAAQDATDHARAQVAHLINAGAAREIVFTSGGIEANILAVRGTAGAYADCGGHLITAASESEMTLDLFRGLEHEGRRVTYMPMDNADCVDEIGRAITEETILISAPFISNDAGSINTVSGIGALAKEAGVIYHVDGGQAVGHTRIDVQAMGIDLLSIDGAVLGGPRGIGALYVRGRKPRVRLLPVIEGGGQERGWRSGTLNVPGIVGLGAACALAHVQG